MLDDTTLAVPALVMPLDGLSEVVRMAVREAIEAAVESELTMALGRAAWERAAAATGYRHGTIQRTLVTSAGPVALTVPRGRLQQPDGSTQEWRSRVLPRYARRTATLDATLARLYLSGASTRDLRRAVAPLFGTTALSKSAVSRVVTRLQDDYRTWQQRSLAEEAIAYLYLDGQRHRVRADGHVTWCSVLMAVGVRRTGEKVVLALRVVGGEQTAAWQQLLEDLTTRGLARPELVISDGSPGAAAALEATWSGLAHQRCLVHKLRNLIACVPRSLRAAVVRDFRTITTAATSTAVHAALAVFRRTWAAKWSAVVVSLDEAGAGLTAFTAFPPAQWRCLRTTNVIERIFSEFRRRTKTQGAFPTPGAMVIVLWGTLATGGIRMRKLHGYKTMENTTLRQAA
ncbi:MAG: IS256 family transposase [Gemmatimonadota bacterium]